MTTLAISDFWVDNDRCLAHFLCVDLAPIVFQMNDEQAWTVSVRPTDFAALSVADTDSVWRAAAHCPVAAIKVKLVTGDVLDARSAMPPIPSHHRLPPPP